MRRAIIILLLIQIVAVVARGQTHDVAEADTLPAAEARPIHRIELEALPSTILHTNEYLRGNNYEGRTMNHAFAARLRYAFSLPQQNPKSQIYKGAYQGVGMAWHDFNRQLGRPLSVYIFQGAKIATLSQRLSFNYEWSLGLTMGWHPYDKESNPENRVIGSKTTAYIDADFYLSYALSDAFDINVGASISHFSNGNTKFPNAGLNVLGAKVGLAYYVNRHLEQASKHRHDIPKFQRGMSYDLVVWGAWKQAGVYLDDGSGLALPGKYGVFGFNFNPMYNINHHLNAGLSIDGTYDRSANLYIDDYIIDLFGDESDVDHVRRPSTFKQMTLGLSGRAEFVMPYFTINVGIGTNLLNATGTFSGVYEVLALKLNTTKRTFLHIGYTLSNFRNPRHLMLGLGYRFGKTR